MSERTEAPTPRRQAEMRKRGEIAYSHELSASITLLVLVYLLASRMPAMISGLQAIMRTAFTGMGRGELTITSLSSGGFGLVAAVAADWLPFFLTIMAVGVVAGLAQTRGLISLHKLKPDLNRVNPVSGIKRIFSKQGLFETGKGLIKMAILGAVLYTTLRNVPAELALQAETDLSAGWAFVGQNLSSMARQCAMLLLLAAAIDYAFQFRQHAQRSKMTRQEVMEDFKNSEGQPMIRARIRQLQRRYSQQRMMQEIIHADVVVTNPTHLAIAIRYDAKKMAAPVVVAKGKDLVAEQIVKRAREHRVPIIQNIPLAHALIHVELQNPIPVDLYQAVAEVLAFVYRLRRRGGVQ